ncbi:MAG: hypothetical protein MJZ76_05850 [Bacteroidales bacterium]|nr:hypothetical protein [Bacteroidales bacterium]
MKKKTNKILLISIIVFVLILVIGISVFMQTHYQKTDVSSSSKIEQNSENLDYNETEIIPVDSITDNL